MVRANMSKDQVEAAASAEEQDAEALAQDAGLTDSDKVVRWYGQPGVDDRTISVADWKQAGLDLEAVEAKTVRWDRANSFTVPLSFLQAFLTDEQIDAWIVRDGRFRIEDK